MCEGKDMDVFRCPGHLVQPFTQQESAVIGMGGQTSLQKGLVLCQSSIPALPSSESHCRGQV